MRISINLNSRIYVLTTAMRGEGMNICIEKKGNYPLMFRAVPGNIVDVSTLPRTITLLSEYGMPTDLSLLDAGYFSAENMQVLYQSGIDFVGRLPERNKNLYNEILEVGQKDLQSKENLTEFHQRSCSPEIITRNRDNPNYLR